MDQNPTAPDPKEPAISDLALTREHATQVKGGAKAKDIFTPIGGIKGESIDDKHKDW